MKTTPTARTLVVGLPWNFSSPLKPSCTSPANEILISASPASIRRRFSTDPAVAATETLRLGTAFVR